MRTDKSAQGKWKAAFRAAFPLTLPICVGFLFLGMSYGFLMKSSGFATVWTAAMSLFIFAGSMEFIAMNLLLASFNPIYSFLLTLMVNARHLFYGISMLERYRGMGWKKPYLVFGLCDETFSINCTAKVPDGVDRGTFYLIVTMLNQCYWVTGAIAGSLLGNILTFNTEGLDFVMTALFTVMLVNQWEEKKDHRPAIAGIAASLLCLLVFGSDIFLIPAMAAIVLIFALMAKREAV